jgi:hypothetical protein
VERRRGEAEQWRREAERRGCKAEQRWAIELATGFGRFSQSGAVPNILGIFSI